MGCGDVCLLNDEGYRAIEGSSRPPLINLTVPIHEQELLDAGDQLVAYLAQQAQAVPARRRPHTSDTAAPRTAQPLRLVRRGTA